MQNLKWFDSDVLKETVYKGRKKSPDVSRETSFLISGIKNSEFTTSVVQYNSNNEERSFLSKRLETFYDLCIHNFV